MKSLPLHLVMEQSRFFNISLETENNKLKKERSKAKLRLHFSFAKNIKNQAMNIQ
jgi:hypothetical protein